MYNVPFRSTTLEIPVQDRLAQHRLLAGAPPEELAWLAAHGHLMRSGGRRRASRPKGEPVRGLLHHPFRPPVDLPRPGCRTPQGHRVPRGGCGGATCRTRASSRRSGEVKAEEPTEIFMIPREEIPALIRDCYELTSIFVHAMLDRARLFTSNDLHEEKMSSLGKLAAGLAHELNNPASAVARSAEGLKRSCPRSEEASRALGAARLSEAQQAAVDRSRELCLAAAGATASGARPSSERTGKTPSPNG